MKIDELPKSIILKDEHFKIYFNTVFETVRNEIWKENLIKHYTKHGIDHSERIVQYLGKLLEDFSTLLNQQERFVLLTAIFLHDIGNQLPRYTGIPIKSTYSTEELEKIRKNHHLSSYEAVKDSIKVNAELPLGLNLCKEYTDFIADLCKYHRKLDLKYLKDTSIAGDPLRLHLLGALLRLGDELDADYRRVNMEVLNIIDIPTESKFYWWSHHYVQSISIDQGHIKLFFRFPEEYKNNNLVEVFQTKRKESLRKQFFEVYDIFENYGVRLYRDIEMGDTNYLSTGSLKPVPSDLLEYIKKTITQTGTNYKELSLKTGVAWEIDGVLYSDNEKVVKALTKIPQLMNKYKYEEAVKIIEDTHLLTMSPKDRMIFSGITGNCYYSLSDFNKAKSYYKDLLKLSERKDLKNVYKIDTILARSASLGNMGNVYQIQGKLKEALQHYQQALDIHREIGNKEGEAGDLGNMGIVYRIQGKLKEALQYHQQALKIDREIGDKEGEANQLCNIGNVYRIQGKLKEALQYHQLALDIHREISNKEGEAGDLGNMGIVYRIQGKLKKAFQYHHQALVIAIARDKEGEANQWRNIGNVYQIQGKLKEALQHYQLALDIHREISNREGEAGDLGNMGIVYRIQGKLEEAFQYHHQALMIACDKEGEANQVCNIGNVYQIQGKLKEALQHYQQALDIHREIGNKEGEANQLGNMGNVYRIQGKLKEALQHYQQTLDIHRKIGKKEGEAGDLGNMGIVYRIQGKLKEAFQHFRKALDIYRKIGAKEGEANQIGNMGSVYRIQGKLKEAFQHYQQALDIHRKIGNKEGEASDLGNIGIVYGMQGKLKETLQHYRKALNIYRKIGAKEGESNISHAIWSVSTTGFRAN